MNRLLLFIILSGIAILLDLYAYQGLKVAIGGFNPTVQRIFKGVFWGLTAATLLSFLLYEPLSNNESGRKWLSILATIGVANILGKLLFALWLVLDDIVRLGRWAWAKLNPQIESSGENGISRSQFLTSAGAITAAIPLASMTWGVVSGAHDYTVRNRRLSIPKLPSAFEGYKIVQISDIHAGSFWSKKAVERGINLINDQKADAVFFTGDIVNNRASELEEWVDVFNRIEGKDGVFSILGNHDYGDYVPWGSAEEKAQNMRNLIQMQREGLGWDLLLDEHRKVTRNGEEIAIVGVENWGARGRFPQYGDLQKASADIAPDTVQLLLSHDPSHWRAQVLTDFPSIDVQFSGHTHGMQFGIEVGNVKWSPVKYFYPEWADLYKEGDKQLYVNRGFGYIGYPGRFGILPEITVFTLMAAPSMT